MKWTLFNIEFFFPTVRTISNRMRDEHSDVQPSRSHLQLQDGTMCIYIYIDELFHVSGVFLFTKKWTRFNIVLSYLQDGAIYLRCSMLVVYAAGNFFTPKTNSFQHCFIFMQVHLKQNEGGARPCNGFYVLFARRYQLGMKEKNLFKMFYVSGECCREIMFRSLVSVFLQYAMNMLIPRSSQAGWGTCTAM